MKSLHRYLPLPLLFSPARPITSPYLRASLHSKPPADNEDPVQLTPNIAEGQHENRVLEALRPLLLDAGGRWLLTQDGKAIYAKFKFKAGFGRTWDFMSAVAEQCKKENHHPEWTNVSAALPREATGIVKGKDVQVYNQVEITWKTHRPEGLTIKDVRMARFCDEIAGEKGGGERKKG
ncbi:MAG: hypothetical protein Q9208_007661 [Pyrenodesmia sp. 3 TL-2023]